jgi:DNA-binding cell septation regulator SpoVG
MKVKDYRAVNSGSLLGFVTIITAEGFEMKGFKLIDGPNGLFVASPSVKGTDNDGNDKYYDQVWIPKELNQELLELVSNEVDSEDLASNTNNAQVPF